MLVKDSEKDTLDKELQNQKARSPMLVKDSGKDTLDKELQFEKA